MSTQPADTAIALSLHPMFTDHMVLQREREVPVWGWAAPGTPLNVTIADQTVRALAGDDGRWMARLAPMPAGGPHELKVAASMGEEIMLSDVLVGEVWIASGQSNMEWPVAWSNDGVAEIAAANWPEIRFITIPHQVSARPLDTVETEGWKACSPMTAGGFSAVAYYFGRDLHKSLDVPIGLVNTSWGGSAMEAWTPLDDMMREPKIMYAQWEWDKWFGEWGWLYEGGARERLLAEWREQTAATGGAHRDPGRAEFTADWPKPEHTSDEWKQLPVPGPWEKPALPLVDGVVWMRRDFDLSAEWAGRDLVMRLGQIDDSDITFFNGEEVGRTGPYPGGHMAKREYQVPARLVREGHNTIAIRIMDEAVTGGLLGPAEDMTLCIKDIPSQSLSLNDVWFCRVELKRQQNPLVVGDYPHGSPAILYNAMIAPLVPFAMRGAIWYQGESNCARHEEYLDLTARMIGAWRSAWGQGDFPFLAVQLAGFDVDWTGWLEVQEAQAAAANKLANYGVATAADVGDAKDIHPKNKQEVGRRLALVARAQVYGEDVVYSGPVARSARAREDGGVAVEFDHLGGGLLRSVRDESGQGEIKPESAGPVSGFELQDASGAWHAAESAIEGEAVVVKSPGMSSPAAIRYNWKNWPDGNLYNHAGLPAMMFRMKVE